MRFGGKLPLLVAVMWLLGVGVASSQEKTLNILGHKVHENAITGSNGGNVIQKWAEENHVKINWITLALDGVHDRLNRELTLNATSVDVAFVLNPWMTDSLAARLEPLDPYNRKAPVENFTGISPSMVAGMTTAQGLLAVPFRHATNGLFVNETILAQRGVAFPDGGINQVFEAARKLTYTKADGTKVYGLAFGAADYSVPMTLLKAMGVNYIHTDHSVHADTPEMVKALQTLHSLYADGVLPPDITTMSIDEMNAAGQNGRAAIIIGNFSRYGNYNDPRKSLFPKQISAHILKDINGAPIGVTELWAIAIPRNSANKDLAWSFIRQVSTPDSTLREAINGNGPIRISAYADKRVQDMLPYWAAESEAIDHATVAFPNVERSAQVIVLFLQEFQAALLGMQTPQEAARILQSKTTELLAH